MSFASSKVLFTSVFLLTLCSAAWAQTQPATLPANYIAVDAPAAQRLALAAKAKHPEVTKIGIHATPPSATDNAIIACDIASKIGKKSSPKDMEKLAMNKPIAERVDKEGIYDLLLPLHDASGHDLGQGFLVMEVPLHDASSEQQALQFGEKVRDELQQQIPDRAALYQR